LIIHEAKDYVVIATGLDKPSINRKTGDMIQTWILVKDEKPTEALKSGRDEIVCGDCSLRGINGKERACYVNLGFAPNNVYRKYVSGGYGGFDLDLFRDRFVRFGSYGEPTLIPFDLVEQIASVASGHTGYTHQWRNPKYQPYSQFFMASCDGTDYSNALEAGWRAFVVSDASIPQLVTCPASKEFEAKWGHRRTCQQCGLCAGTSRPAKSIVIAPHGSGAKYA